MKIIACEYSRPHPDEVYAMKICFHKIDVQHQFLSLIKLPVTKADIVLTFCTYMVLYTKKSRR